ncbi:hypothetical protein HY346_00860 [Candidatus Microgenomates bacterium]|nr:hypothetical protein [Candidatus Microgenomates bacterium]
MPSKRPLPERRQDSPRLVALEGRCTSIEARCTTIEEKLDKNTAATERVEKNTSEIVGAWKALSGGLKVLGWLGIVAKYMAYVLGAVSAAGGAWYAITHWGEAPKPPQIHP